MKRLITLILVSLAIPQIYAGSAVDIPFLILVLTLGFTAVLLFTIEEQFECRPRGECVGGLSDG